MVVATAEPNGAYHLDALAPALPNFPATSLTHLVPPGVTPVGAVRVPVSHDQGILDRADHVVITGGSLTEWTRTVARAAADLQLPLTYSQLAWLPANPVTERINAWQYTALSEADADLVSTCFATSGPVRVTGTPLLDHLPPANPVPGRVLVVSMAEPELPDPGGVLTQAAGVLQREGFEVLICPHPREDRSPWYGFEVSAEPTFTVAPSAQFAIGYPSSSWPVFAHLGVPIVGLDITGFLRSNVPSHVCELATSYLSKPEEAPQAVRSALPVKSRDLIAAAGPVGDAAETVLSAWSQFPTSDF